MPKKAIKKVKIEKVVIQPVNNIVSSNEDKVKELQNLILTQGWKIIKEAMDVNIEFMGEEIITKFDPINKKALTDQEIDNIRFKRSSFKELKDFPELLIKTLSHKQTTELKNYDPYLTVSDIKK